MWVPIVCVDSSLSFPVKAGTAQWLHLSSLDNIHLAMQKILVSYLTEVPKIPPTKIRGNPMLGVCPEKSKPTGWKRASFGIKK